MDKGIFLDENRRLYRDERRGLWVDSRIASEALGVSRKALLRSVAQGRCQVRVLRIGYRLRFNARDLGLLDGKEE
jgi:hypothetical protein